MEEKITSKSGLDQNTFDGLFQTVLEHLESKCYPNFLTSEVYIEYVQSYQTQECSEGASVKYQSSTASSISGHPQKNADDSGKQIQSFGRSLFFSDLDQIKIIL